MKKQNQHPYLCNTIGRIPLRRGWWYSRHERQTCHHLFVTCGPLICGGGLEIPAGGEPGRWERCSKKRALHTPAALAFLRDTKAGEMVS